jgi:hypothetical protein
MRIKPGSKLAAAMWSWALLLAAAEGSSPPKDAVYAVVAGTYVVRASMKGFQPAEKEVSVTGEERVEVTLVLSSESK